MKPSLMVLKTPQDIELLTEYLKDFEYIAYDCETTGLHKSSEVIGISVCAEEDKAFYIVLAYWDPTDKVLKYYDTREATTELIRRLKGHQIIMHNAIFDAIRAQAFFKIRLIDSVHTDTMILAHLLNENRRVGLKDLGQEYFGVSAALEQAQMKASVLANGGSTTKGNYEMYKADVDLLGRYGAQDALLTFKLFNVLVPELFKQGLDKFFYEDESMPLLRTATFDLNDSGLKLDQDRMMELKKTLQAECLEHHAYIHTSIQPYIKDKYPGTNKKNTFNIGAAQQLSWLLFGILGLDFDTLTKGGKEVCRGMGIPKLPYTKSARREFIHSCLKMEGMEYAPKGLINGKTVRAKKVKTPWAYTKCDKTVLKKYAKQYKWVQALLDYNRKMKLLSTYIEGVQERVKYGIIHPSFLQAGTTSGRYSSKNPNFQNLPRNDKRIKECIISRPGKVFVGADYSQLEPRVFASVSGDEGLFKAFDGTSDFYSVIGMEVYDKTDCTPQKEGSPDAFGVKYAELRDLSKVIALASTYGALASKLMHTTGKSKDDTQQDMDRYFEAFPKVAKMMKDSHALAKKSGQATTLFGRIRHIPEAKDIERLYPGVEHRDLPYDARKVLNLSVNHRIQGTGANIVNRAAIAFYQKCREKGIVAPIVAQVHDSLIAECLEKDALQVAEILQDAMENTVTIPGVSLEAIPKIGNNLSQV